MPSSPGCRDEPRTAESLHPGLRGHGDRNQGAPSLAAPLAVGALFGRIVPADERLALVGLALALIAVGLAGGLLQIVRGLAIQRAQTRVGVSVQGALWDRLLRLPPRFFRPYT